MENNVNNVSNINEANSETGYKVRKPKRKRTKKIIVLDIIIVLLVIGIGVCVYQLGSYYIGNMQQEKEFDKIRSVDQETEAQRKARYAKLYEENKDFVAWINIEGAGINYPVMQTKNDFEYYLRRNFKKEYSRKGTPFLSPDSEMDPAGMYTLMFGHHMRDKSMFSGLLRYKEESFFKLHKKIRYDMLEHTAEYEIFGAVLTDATGEENQFPVYSFYNYSTEGEYAKFIGQIKSKSLIKSDLEPKYPDKLIALSTCEYSQKDGRMVVFGVLKSEREYKTDEKK
jgi:sortase B